MEIACVRFPRISNYDDLLPLEHEPGVVVRFVEDPEELPGADLVVLPGTKSTIADLGWLEERGFVEPLRRRASDGEPLLGICGGFQMLGERIEDPDGVESATGSRVGLGLLPVVTRYGPDKVTDRVVVRTRPSSGWWAPGSDGLSSVRLSGYEIHMGRVEASGGDIAHGQLALLEVVERNGEGTAGLDGAAGPGGAVVGTLVHGLFDDAPLRESLVRSLRARKGLPRAASVGLPADDPYDRLADAVERHLDVDRILALAGAG